MFKGSSVSIVHEEGNKHRGKPQTLEHGVQDKCIEYHYKDVAVELNDRPAYSLVVRHKQCLLELQYLFYASLLIFTEPSFRKAIKFPLEIEPECYVGNDA